MVKTYAETLRGASHLLATAGIDPDGARYVLEVRAGFTPSQLRLHDREPMPAALATQFAADVKRLLANEPAQYIVGRAPFYGEWFQVSPAVLIPRFETEELVAWVVADQVTATSGLDVGTGSGAIGLTLSRQLSAAMTLSDVSPAALAVARANAAAQGAAVTLVQSDLFAALPDRYDFIVANLPYISRAETAVMDASTLQYEPDLALFAAHDGLALFERFIQAAPAHLNPGGRIYLEYGFQQAPALATLFAETVPQAVAEFRRDMAGQPRMVRLSFTE